MAYVTGADNLIDLKSNLSNCTSDGTLWTNEYIKKEVLKEIMKFATNPEIVNENFN